MFYATHKENIFIFHYDVRRSNIKFFFLKGKKILFNDNKNQTALFKNYFLYGKNTYIRYFDIIAQQTLFK